MRDERTTVSRPARSRAGRAVSGAVGVVGAIAAVALAWGTTRGEPRGGAPIAGDGGPVASAGEVVASGAVVPGYVGSEACASCHEKAYREWRASLHSKMEQAATPSSVLGEWTTDGTVVATEAAGRRIVLRRDGDRYVVEAPGADGKAATHVVERTVGNRHKQTYLTKFADGSWHPLPVMWLVKDRKFVEWLHLASRDAGSGKSWADTGWSWQLKCAGCHVTGLDLAYDATAKTFATRWQDLSIGCEACHGPGRAHVDAKGGTGNVLCPSRMTKVQQDDTCGKCHSRGTAGPEQGAPAGLPGRLAYPYNMPPGARLDDRFVQVQPEANAAEFVQDVTKFLFWPDGSSFNHHQQLNDWRRSGMLVHGGDSAPSCTTCHEPHRAADLKMTVVDNALCLSCHAAFEGRDALARHTGHGGDPAANAGARCVECHMPRIVSHAGSERLRSHTYWSPNPARLGKDEVTPISCLSCHAGKDRAWARAAAAKIWPPAPK